MTLQDALKASGDTKWHTWGMTFTCESIKSKVKLRCLADERWSVRAWMKDAGRRIEHYESGFETAEAAFASMYTQMHELRRVLKIDGEDNG